MPQTTDIQALDLELTDDEAIELALQDLRDDLTPPSEATVESDMFDQAPHAMEELEASNYGPIYRGCAIVGVIVLLVALALVYQLVYTQTTIPNVVGQTVSEATALLKDAGLEVAAISEKEVAGVAPGTIVEQSPRADTKVKKGTAVSMVFAVEGSQTRVPNVVGRTAEEAEAALLNSRLSFDKVITFSDTVAEGIVMGQLPASGTAVDGASAVTVLISGGSYSRLFASPKVTGLGKDEAVKLIQDVGLTPVVAYAATAFGSLDEVVAQTPKSKTSVAPKSVVFLLLSRTPSVADIAVPDIVGKTRDEAQAVLVSAGFRVETFFAVDQAAAPGMVIAQNPISKDVTAAKGETIYLLVSSGPEPRAVVPDILGKTIEQARAELIELGFSVHVTQNAAALNERSPVTQQFPAGGEEYNRGLDVVIYAAGE